MNILFISYSYHDKIGENFIKDQSKEKARNPSWYKGLRAFYLYDLNRVRTCDPYPVKIVLSQLSYQIMLATINNISEAENEVNTFYGICCTLRNLILHGAKTTI